MLGEQTSLPGTHRLWSHCTARSGNPSQGQVLAMSTPAERWTFSLRDSGYLPNGRTISTPSPPTPPQGLISGIASVKSL